MHMAPEVLNRKPYTSKVDVWSTCIVLYGLLFGEMPFEGDTDQKITHNIIKSEINYERSYWKNISPEAVDFFKLGLIKDPKKRPNCHFMLNHPWL